MQCLIFGVLPLIPLATSTKVIVGDVIRIEKHYAVFNTGARDAMHASLPCVNY